MRPILQTTILWLVLSICTLTLHAQDTPDDILMDTVSENLYLSNEFTPKDDFSHKMFINAISFDYCHFHGNADFASDKFKEFGNFFTSEFEDSVDFTYTKFFEDVYFNDTKFDKYALFTLTVFDSTGIFRNTIFKKNVSFERAEFAKTALFYKVGFDSLADFSYAELKHKLILEKLSTTPSTYFNFDRTTFGDTIDLSNNPILYHDINLSIAYFANRTRVDTTNHSIFDGIIHVFKEYFAPYNPELNNSNPIYINLYNTDISKIKIDYKNFKLYFLDSDADTVRSSKHFESGKLDTDRIAAIYESLLKNFKERGQTESEENLAIEYEYFKNGDSFYTRLRDWWYRFGYEKGRIFKHVLLFLFTFTMITFAFLPFLHEKVYPLETLNVKYGKRNAALQKTLLDEKEPAFDPNFRQFRRRLWFSFIYTSIIFFLFSLKIDSLKFTPKFKNIVGMIYVLLVYTVGIICIAYMANFVLQK